MFSKPVAAFDALRASVASVRELNFDQLKPQERLQRLAEVENAVRELVACGYDVIGGLAKEDPADLGGPPHQVIANYLRISCAEARRRIRDVAQLSPRLTLTGQQLPPELPATAQAWREGLLDGQHLRVIQAFVRDLPEETPVAVVEHAERFLAEQAALLRPDQLEKAAHRAALLINPDGKFSDADRARQRGFTWSSLRSDGMSVGKLVASPDLRANIDAWLAKFAAPGMCNPADEKPCVAGEPTEEAARTDTRTPAQRQHDALNALVRGQLGDPKLGQHNGLPVTVIVSTTLQELTAASGRAVTGGGTVLPMRDLIRMASHAYHYLAVYDQHSARPLYLGRTRRIASPDQRIVLYDKDSSIDALLEYRCARSCLHPNLQRPEARRAWGATSTRRLPRASRPTRLGNRRPVRRQRPVGVLR
ncbi:hypothetical protein MCNS_16450 [Mycobacterium conspicuum]|uniref:DUF222 domain-containing protein n=1 Tax=Mycobacterium conspicuum TaxID=44010 RepID=A0A7I7YBZ3_9MYCO|nr:hypothetical protein MCNS_16450 [Mycobacterium conspicuum]